MADQKLFINRLPIRLVDNGDGTYAITTTTNGQITIATLPELPAGNNNIGNVDVVTMPSIPAGTNNIGDVDVLTLPNVTLNALPAGTNNIGDVDVLSMPIPKDHCLEVARGNVSGMASVHKFGNNPAIGTSYETIWSGGGIYAYPSSAVQMSIVSTSVNDDGNPVGTGARTLTIYGLDANYAELSETVTLDGTTPVVTAGSYIRVYRMIVRTVGSTGSNVGTISATNGGVTYAIIEATYNQTLMTPYTVPAGKTAYLKNWYVNTGKLSDLEVDMYVRPFGECFQLKEHIHVYENNFEYEFCVPLKYTEKSDIEIRAKTSSGSQEASAGFDLILVDN